MAYSTAYPLLENASETGDPLDWPGGEGTFAVYAGTFGGATVALKWSPDGGTTYLPVDQNGDIYVTLTAVGGGNFRLPPCKIVADVSGGSPSGLYANVSGVPE